MATVTFPNVSTADHNDGARALSNFSLEVRDRELLVLASPAAGLSASVLRTLAGLQPVSSGEIKVGERAVEKLPPHERDLAMVFQSHALHEHLTVRGNIALGTHGRGFPKVETAKRVQQAASILGIEPLLDRKPGELTGAQRLWTALAQAVVRQPKVFLLEEPLVVLDTGSRDATRTELVKLQQRLQATFICAVANPIDAMALGDRVAVLDRGALQQIDFPGKLYTQPATLSVARYVGAPAMNLIRGKLRSTPTGIVFKEADGGTLELPLVKRGELEALAGRDLIAGIRPEEIRLAPSGAPARGVRFQGVVDVVEALGAETLFTVQTGAHVITSRNAGAIDRAEAGHRLQFEIDPEKVRLFDPDTGSACI